MFIHVPNSEAPSSLPATDTNPPVLGTKYTTTPHRPAQAKLQDILRKQAQLQEKQPHHTVPPELQTPPQAGKYRQLSTGAKQLPQNSSQHSALGGFLTHLAFWCKKHVGGKLQVIFGAERGASCPCLAGWARTPQPCSTVPRGAGPECRRSPCLHLALPRLIQSGNKNRGKQMAHCEHCSCLLRHRLRRSQLLPLIFHVLNAGGKGKSGQDSLCPAGGGSSATSPGWLSSSPGETGGKLIPGASGALLEPGVGFFFSSVLIAGWHL